MLTRGIAGLLAIMPALGAVGIYGVEQSAEPIDYSTAAVVAISELGHQVVMSELTVDELHEATRSGVNMLGLEVGDAVDFDLDGTAVRVEQVTPFCSRTMTSSPPFLATPGGHPWIGRASTTVGVSRAAACGDAVTFIGMLLWGPGLHRVAAETPEVTVPAGQTGTRTVTRECTNSNPNSFQSAVTWRAGSSINNWQFSNIVSRMCGF